MSNTLLDLYCFLRTPGQQDLIALNDISIESIQIELLKQPETRILVRTYRSNPQSELFAKLVTPQAYRDYANFLQCIKEHLKTESIFKSLLLTITENLLISEDITKAFDSILEQWQFHDAEQALAFSQQAIVKEWYIEQLSKDDTKGQALIDMHYQNIKTVLANQADANDLMPVVIETMLQNPFKLAAYIKWMIEDHQKTPESIVESELFHWFLLQHIDKLDVKNEVFQYFFSQLKNTATHHESDIPQYLVLLNILENTAVHCVKEIPRTLTGKQVHQNIPAYHKLIKPTLLCTPILSVDVEGSYYLLFGLPYLVKALTFKILFSLDEINFLVRKLNELPIKDFLTCLRISTSDETKIQFSHRINQFSFAKLFENKHWQILDFANSQNTTKLKDIPIEKLEMLFNDLSSFALEHEGILGLATLYQNLNNEVRICKDITFEIMLKNYIQLYHLHDSIELSAFFRMYQVENSSTILKVCHALNQDPLNEITQSITDTGWNQAQINAAYDVWASSLHAQNELKYLFPHVGQYFFESKVDLDAWIIQVELQKRQSTFNLNKILLELYGKENTFSYSETEFLHIAAVLHRVKNSNPVENIDITLLNLYLPHSEDQNHVMNKITRISLLEEVRSNCNICWQRSPLWLIQFALAYAAQYDSSDLLEALLSEPEDLLDALLPVRDDPPRHLIDSLSETKVADAIASASYYGSSSVFKNLLAYAKTQPNIINHNMSAVNNMVRFNRIDFLEIFISALSEEFKSPMRTFAMEIAVQRRMTTVIQHLVLAPKEQNIAPEQIDYALTFLMENNELTILKKYFELKNKNEATTAGLTILFSTMFFKIEQDRILQFLADIAKLNIEQYSSIFLKSCEEGSLALINIMLSIQSNWPSPDILDKGLEHACAFDRVEVIRTLLDLKRLKGIGPNDPTVNKTLRYLLLRLDLPETLVDFLELTKMRELDLDVLISYIETAIEFNLTEKALKLLKYVSNQSFNAIQTQKISTKAIQHNSQIVIEHIAASHSLYQLSNSFMAITHWTMQINNRSDIFIDLLKLHNQRIINFENDNDLSTLFYKACTEGLCSAAECLVLYKGRNKLSAAQIKSGIRIAVENDNADFIKHLLTALMPAPVKQKITDGILPGLFTSASAAVFAALLEYIDFLDCISPNEKRNFLATSAQLGKKDFLVLALQHRGVLRIERDDYLVAFKKAIINQHTEIIEILLSQAITHFFTKFELKTILTLAQNHLLYHQGEENMIKNRNIIDKLKHRLIIAKLARFIDKNHHLQESRLNFCFFAQSKTVLTHQINAAAWLLSIVKQETTFSSDDQNLHLPYIVMRNSKLPQIYQSILEHEKLGPLFQPNQQIQSVLGSPPQVEEQYQSRPT